MYQQMRGQLGSRATDEQLSNYYGRTFDYVTPNKSRVQIVARARSLAILGVRSLVTSLLAVIVGGPPIVIGATALVLRQLVLDHAQVINAFGTHSPPYILRALGLWLGAKEGVADAQSAVT